ncbi:MAG: hypothetical protein ACRCXC_00665 [Legionella sp.]
MGVPLYALAETPASIEYVNRLNNELLAQIQDMRQQLAQRSHGLPGPTVATWGYGHDRRRA